MATSSIATHAESCPLCDSFAATTVKGVVRHIGLVQSNEPGFRITCGVGGCTRTYTKFNSYKKHMYVKHGEVMRVTVTASREGQCNLDMDVLDHCSSFPSIDEGTDEPSDVYVALRDRNTALFVLKAREILKIRQSSMNHLLGDISTYIDMIKNRLIQNVDLLLREKGICMTEQLQIICNSSDVSDPFSGFRTEYLQKQYFISHFNLVEPIEIKLGRSLQTITRRSRRYNKLSWDCGYYVSLLSSLHQVLSDDLVLSEVLRGHTCGMMAWGDGLLSDYCDGSAYGTHPLFSQTFPSLEIMLYYDDVEVCNPLGSRTKTHKLVKSSFLVKYGADKILMPVIEEIKELERECGVTFTIRGSEYTFRGTVSLFPADKLASQFVGGYKALNPALRKCRQCLAVQEDMQTEFLADAFEARTRQTHANHCSQLGGPLHNHYATTYGLHRDSILNQLQYFHVTEGLVPDIMHDCLEECVQYEVKEMLKYLSSERILSVSALNHLIQSFPYFGPDARNHPSPVTAASLASSDHALKQTATQMWCLARLLPLIIGSEIPTDNGHWYNFLLLLEMLDYIFAPTITPTAVAQLKVLINEHHSAFTSLYPTCSVTPKMHYIVHYPDLILRYGPLVRSWCMRFEGKHNYFKDLAHRVKCFRNIPKTLASRHQTLVCYHFAADQSSIFKEPLFGPVKEVEVSSLEYSNDFARWFPGSTHIRRTSWAEIKGTKYSLQNVVVLDSTVLPEFGDIVISDAHQPFFVCKKLTTSHITMHTKSLFHPL